MRIEKVEIRNLRCIKLSDADLEPYTCFVGPNGAGKSTILCALNIFFRNLENAPTDLSTLTAEDFHLQDVSEPVEVRVTFRDLSPEAKAEMKEYVRQERLTITAVATFDPLSKKAVIKQYGERLGIPEFALFFKAYGDGASATELKQIFEDLRESDAELAKASIKTTKDGLRDGLKAFEAARPARCKLIRSEDQFYGVSGGKDRLAKYVQWVYVPAVKDVSEEQQASRTSALGKLLARTVNAQTNFKTRLEVIENETRAKYQEMLDSSQAALTDITTAIGARLADWSHPDARIKVVWEQDAASAVRLQPPTAGIIAGESGFEGRIARLGHGLQRSLLLALLQEVANLGSEKAPTLILGCEEPELYQHPPQARHLAEVFEKLSQGGQQIILTTHSPYFVSGEYFESVRLVRRVGLQKCAQINSVTFADFSKRYSEATGKLAKSNAAAQAKLHQTLQPALSEMFFTERLVLVEGLEDMAYIRTWVQLTGKSEAFRRAGVHIVPVQGKSELIRPTIIALGLYMPLLVVADADGDKLMRYDKELQAKVDSPEARANHERDNRALTRLLGGDESNLFPSGPLFYERLILWPSDLATFVKSEFISSLGSQGQEQFEHLEAAARNDAGDAGELNKNTMYIGHLLTRLKDAGAASASLDQLCAHIIDFGTAKLEH